MAEVPKQLSLGKLLPKASVSSWKGLVVGWEWEVWCVCYQGKQCLLQGIHIGASCYYQASSSWYWEQGGGSLGRLLVQASACGTCRSQGWLEPGSKELFPCSEHSRRGRGLLTLWRCRTVYILQI